MKKQIIAFSLALASIFTFNTGLYFCNDVSALTVIAQIKDISLDKDVIKVGETTHIDAEWDTGSTFQANCSTSDSSVVKVVSGSADMGWEIEGINEGSATITVTNSYCYSKSIDITVESDSENFDWLPKTMDEFEKFIEENGTVSTHGKYIVCCDKIDYSAGAEVIMEQTGSAEIKKIKEYSIEDEEEPIPPGTLSSIVYVYEAVSSGDVKITISQGRPWDTEYPREIKSSENYKVDENLNITKVTENNSVSGDINADGLFNIADITLLKKWLFNPSDTEIKDWKAADLSNDGKLDVFDLCIMKNELLNQNQYDSTPLLMITMGDYSECYEQVVTADGNRYSKILCNCAYLSVEEHMNHIKDEGEKEQYITDTEVLQKISEFAKDAEKYKDCEMKDIEFSVADISQINLSVLYKDENGNMQSLELYRFGNKCAWLDNLEVRDFVKMLIEKEYIPGKDYIIPGKDYILD